MHINAKRAMASIFNWNSMQNEICFSLKINWNSMRNGIFFLGNSDFYFPWTILWDISWFIRHQWGKKRFIEQEIYRVSFSSIFLKRDSRPLCLHIGRPLSSDASYIALEKILNTTEFLLRIVIHSLFWIKMALIAEVCPSLSPSHSVLSLLFITKTCFFISRKQN